jgi:hypothetical protein
MVYGVFVDRSRWEDLNPNECGYSCYGTNSNKYAEKGCNAAE